MIVMAMAKKMRTMTKKMLKKTMIVKKIMKMAANQDFWVWVQWVFIGMVMGA